MDDYNDTGPTITFLRAGQRIFARYVLVRLLGRGGMGVVWLARDEELQRDVALKFVPELLAADRDAITDLKREVRRALELTHPHIVRSYDFVADTRHAAISMEFVPGATFAARRSEQPHGHFEVADLALSVRQLGEALGYAHTKAKVVHRDLKPANLMFDAQGDLKIADFGIAATLADSHTRLSQRASASGTPLYMSPQQMMGEKPAVTDDIYALGATLYELLTGKPPFHTGRIDLQLLNKLPTRLAVRREELEVPGQPIPEAWEETIAACLAKEPANRPQSAREVLERLDLLTTRLASNPESAPARPDGVSVASSASPRASEPAITHPRESGFVARIRASFQPIKKPTNEMLRDRGASGPGAPAALSLSSASLSANRLRMLRIPRLRARWIGGATAALVLVGIAYYFDGWVTMGRRKAEVMDRIARDVGLVRITSEPDFLTGEIARIDEGLRHSRLSDRRSYQSFKTPCTRELPAGEYEMVLHRSGWPDQRRELKVTSGLITSAHLQFDDTRPEIRPVAAPQSKPAR